MNANRRPAIPSALERQIKIESGHRCAIPTCRQWPVELAHIIPFRTVKDHSFDNLIALCPTCHSRYDNTKDIDRKSMQIYKSNLGIVNSRFMELEKHLLQSLDSTQVLPIPGTMEWVFSALQKDGLIEVVSTSGISMSGIEAHYFVQLTIPGKELVKKWLGGQPLD